MPTWNSQPNEHHIDPDRPTGRERSTMNHARCPLKPAHLALVDATGDLTDRTPPRLHLDDDHLPPIGRLHQQIYFVSSDT